MIDEHKEEILSLYVLDLLEDGEKIAFEAELARNLELQQQVAELRATSSRLGLLAPQMAPPPALRDRLLASVKPHAATAAPASSKIVRFPAAAILGWAAAACFAAFTGLLATKVARLDRELSSAKATGALAQTNLASLHTEFTNQKKASELALLKIRREADVAELKVISLASLLGDSPKAQAIAVWNPLTQEGVLTVVNLPALTQDKDYQLWLVDPQYATPVNGGTFRVDPATGEAHITFKPDRPVNTASKFAVSLERKGGVAKAEGPMVLINP